MRLPAGARLVVVAGALLAAALAVALVVLVADLRRARAEDARRDDVLRAARQFAVDFQTLDHRHVDADVQRVLRGATGAFAQDYRGRAAEVERIARDNRSVSTGVVKDAGIASLDDDSARVLVAADSTVANKGAPQGQLRSYRLALELTREGGRWLVSDVQFVG